MKKYDVVVVGAGPTGLIAAGRAAELGARVLVLEKNENPGVKLLITGKERCNITNFTENIRELIDCYGKNGKFLYSSFHRFGVLEVINFFNQLGVDTKIERGNRVFPESDESRDVLEALLKYLDWGKVELRTNSAVKKIVKEENRIKKIVLHNGQEVVGDNYILSTGGKSYPATGSTGDGYNWLGELGHTVVDPRPVLSPIICADDFISDLEGLSLRNVEVSVWRSYDKLDSAFGEALFTANGMSGPVILNLSKNIKAGEDYELSIDFKPALSESELDDRILRDFEKNNNKDFKNSLTELLPKKLIPVFVKLSGIDPEKKVNLVSRDERRELLALFKDFRLKVVGLVGFKKAIITSGGVDIKEVDPKTMKSKIVENLYIAGELLDIDGPTGGYNLQICWSTGFTAGESAAT